MDNAQANAAIISGYLRRASVEFGIEHDTLLNDFLDTRDESSFYDLGQTVGLTAAQCGAAQRYLNSL